MQHYFTLSRIYFYFLIIVNALVNYQFYIQSSPLFVLNVAILSARENFDKRQNIRDTWFQHIRLLNQISSEQNFGFQIYAHFVLGTRSCDISPIDRNESYGCDPKLPGEDEVRTVFDGRSKTLFSQANKSNKPQLKTLFKGFSFKVRLR